MVNDWRRTIQKLLRTKDFTLRMTDCELDAFIAEVQERWDNPYQSLRQRYTTFEICVADLLRERGLQNQPEQAG
jgi:hypothetical protein